jgi:predicted ATPase
MMPVGTTNKPTKEEQMKDVIVELPVLSLYEEALPFLAETISEALRSRGLIVGTQEISVKVMVK